MRRMFLRLTELGEATEDTRRRVPLAELAPGSEPHRRWHDLLDKLARRGCCRRTTTRPRSRTRR